MLNLFQGLDIMPKDLYAGPVTVYSVDNRCFRLSVRHEFGPFRDGASFGINSRPDGR
jgi:hypothetical protein